MLHTFALLAFPNWCLRFFIRTASWAEVQFQNVSHQRASWFQQAVHILKQVIFFFVCFDYVFILAELEYPI